MKEAPVGSCVFDDGQRVVVIVLVTLPVLTKVLEPEVTVLEYGYHLGQSLALKGNNIRRTQVVTVVRILSIN